MAETLTLRIKPYRYETLAVSLATARLAVQRAIEDAEDAKMLAATLENLNRLLAAVEKAETSDGEKQSKG